LPTPPHFEVVIAPHFKNLANTLADLRAIVSEYADLARQEDKRRRRQLLNEQAAHACQAAADARARQEAADARACQEAAAACDPPGRASQDNYDEYEDDYDEYNNDYDEYDDDYDEYDDDKDEYDDDYNYDEDAEDEYEDIAGQFFARIDATMAKLQAMDDGFENRAAAQGKALADKANKREWAAARDKALADELRQSAALEKALADKATEQRRADTLKKALADEAKECHEAAAQAKVLAAKVLADKQGGQELAVRGNLLKTVCQRTRPCVHVGRRHGPQSPNTQKYLLCGRRHRPRAPNQSTVNGWA
jgi:hypothetical protein